MSYKNTLQNLIKKFKEQIVDADAIFDDKLVPESVREAQKKLNMTHWENRVRELTKELKSLDQKEGRLK